MLVDKNGKKLSKRNYAESIKLLKDKGMSPSEVVDLALGNLVMSELDFIEKVSRVSLLNDSIEVGIGDDCSVMRDKRKLVTVDMLSDMVHFDTAK